MKRTDWFEDCLEREPRTHFGKEWRIDPPVEIEKPCHSAGFCPYGQLVEAFPIHEEESAEAIKRGWYSQTTLPNGETIKHPDLNRVFKELGSLSQYSCKVFGHNCPVFYCAEPLAE